VENLKQRLEDANYDKAELNKQVDRLQSDQFNQANVGNIMNE